MKKLTCLIAVALCMSVLCGCGSDSDKSECEKVIEDFTSCGGDLVGTWVFEGQCVDIEYEGEIAEQFEQIEEMCPGFELEISGDMDGTVEISEDPSIIHTEITSQELIMSIVCLEGASCDLLETALESAFEGQPGVSVGCSGGGDCECDITMALGGDETTDEYEIDGNNLVILGPEDLVMPYCVTGDKVVLLQSQDDEEMSGDIYMRLKKQS